MTQEEFLEKFEEEKQRLYGEYLRRLGYVAARMNDEAYDLGLKFDFKENTFVKKDETKK